MGVPELITQIQGGNNPASQIYVRKRKFVLMLESKLRIFFRKKITQKEIIDGWK